MWQKRRTYARCGVLQQQHKGAPNARVRGSKFWNWRECISWEKEENGARLQVCEYQCLVLLSLSSEKVNDFRHTDSCEREEKGSCILFLWISSMIVWSVSVTWCQMKVIMKKYENHSDSIDLGNVMYNMSNSCWIYDVISIFLCCDLVFVLVALWSL